MRAYFIVFSFLIIFPIRSVAQITVAPSYIIINDKNPNGDIYIKNSGNTRVEVITEVFFGYFSSDSAGGKIFIVKDSMESLHSAADWISIYPKKFNLFSSEEKRLRIISRAPIDLKPGEYWARIKIFTSPVNSNENNMTDSVNISVKLGINFSFVIPVYFRKGITKTGISITDFYKKTEKGGHAFFVNLKREEEAAYRGNIIFRIKNQAGDPVFEKKQTTVVYYNMLEKFIYPINGLLPGFYFAEVELNTSITGKENLLISQPVFKSFSFEIP
jgi:hypothetical protein